MKISRIIKETLNSNPYLFEYIQLDLINISAASDFIRGQIAKQDREDISSAAIGMAIRRISQQHKKKSLIKYNFPLNIAISTRSHIYELSVQKNSLSKTLVKKLHERIVPSKSDIFSVIEGNYEIVIIASENLSTAIKKIFKKAKVTSELNNLSFISVDWSSETKDIPGIYYQVTRALAFKNISIQSFRTIGSEMSIYFKEADFLPAYETIKELFEKGSIN